jgi:hypothetical protein
MLLRVQIRVCKLYSCERLMLLAHSFNSRLLKVQLARALRYIDIQSAFQRRILRKTHTALNVCLCMYALLSCMHIPVARCKRRKSENVYNGPEYAYLYIN